MLRNLNKCPSNEASQEFLVDTPIGKLELTSCSLGLHKISIKDVHKNDYDLEKDVILIRDNDEQEMKTIIMDAVEYLSGYFNNAESKLPKICWPSICKKDSFTEKVLKALFEKTSYGDKLSYKELATLCGNSQASRAVGTVMRRNQIPLIIPCHRVIKSDESLGNYSGGSGCNLKKWLLEHEAKFD